MSQAVQCSQCGGAIANTPGKELPECLFCGAPASSLVDFEQDEAIEDPTGFIPFEVVKQRADNQFREFAKSSFWYPNDLRDASLELRKLLLPAWAWSGEVETHWAALVRANTQSGKRPIAGADRATFEQILVPASQTLTLREMSGLGAYDEAALQPFEPADSDPYEISEMTRSVAKNAALAEMENRHRAQIRTLHSAETLKGHSTMEQLDGRPVLVPVWIGAYRYNDAVYRFLVNGQTGEFLGTAPTSIYKVIGVVLAVAVAILVLVSAVSLCVGGGLLVGS